MDMVSLARQVEERYRRYLKTTFQFRDPDLRSSFEHALDSGHLAKGPFLEATPVFRRGLSPRALFGTFLGRLLDEGFLKGVKADRPLFLHQEQAIRKADSGQNVVVATGTGSGKTEAFLYPILLALYREHLAGSLGPGVRALILYPMNALANDQRERLGEICGTLRDGGSSFEFTFGQYIGDTPEDERDSDRHARDVLDERRDKAVSRFDGDRVVHGELVLRTEIRRTPPHILLTNYSMLEYLLLRPDDSPLFDNGRASRWRFLVLDEAHQYRGSRGVEMAMLLRRLKQRLREGGRTKPFTCIATSATLSPGPEGASAVATFAADLFNEAFRPEDVIMGEREAIPSPSTSALTPSDYDTLGRYLDSREPEDQGRVTEISRRLGLTPEAFDARLAVGRILQRDQRTAGLREGISGQAEEVSEVARRTFPDLSPEAGLEALSRLVELLVRVPNPGSGAALLSPRYHLFLRSLEGAFVSYWPEKKVSLDRGTPEAGGAAFFEVALCRECGQHYFVGRKEAGRDRLVEAVRDPGDPKYGASFYRPVDNGAVDGEDEEGPEAPKASPVNLCVQCGKISRLKPDCGHTSLIQVVKEDAPKDEDRADQIARCGACGYNASGRDPVRELVHGTDGPHAVIATTLHQLLPDDRKKVLAFADGRQEAAFFAW